MDAIFPNNRAIDVSQDQLQFGVNENELFNLSAMNLKHTITTTAIP